MAFHWDCIQCKHQSWMNCGLCGFIYYILCVSFIHNKPPLKGYIWGTFVTRSTSDAYKNKILHILLKFGAREKMFFFVMLYQICKSKAIASLKKYRIINHLNQSSVQSLSCLTLCDPVDCSTPGLPVHHQLPEFTQTHVHWVGDAIKPSHPLSSPSPPAFSLSQHQGLSQWVSSSCQFFASKSM